VALDEAMAFTNRLLTSADALAAMTARLRLGDLDGGADPALCAQLDRVADVLGARAAYDGLTDQERAVVVAFARSYLRQAVDLVEDPLREPGWSYTDPVLLQAQGSASAGVAHLFQAAGLGAPNARILDVGTGVAGLAIAFCRTYPEATVVGLDPWEPALQIARGNVKEAGLESRITLLASTIEDFRDEGGFDLAWLPSFFIPEAVLDDATARIHELLRPGGTLVVGTTQGEKDSLETAVDQLRNIRSGGSVVSPSDALIRLERAGFANVHQPDLGADVPLRLAVGTRA
jgi:2-polyprenyl-3-methyl-5-hydroxy-6-metoxy-1,4-benzoquinol methylase